VSLIGVYLTGVHLLGVLPGMTPYLET
jgi:hypothetical protein